MFCEGGSLASIEDPFEQEFIQSNANIFKDSHTSFWIGLFQTHKGTVTYVGSFMKSNIHLHRKKRLYKRKPMIGEKLMKKVAYCFSSFIFIVWLLFSAD